MLYDNSRKIGLGRVLLDRFGVRMFGENGPELVYDFGLLTGDVFGLERIGVVVVEFEFGGVRSVAWLLPFDESMALRADGSTKGLLGKAVEGVVAHAGIRVFENGHEAESIDGLGA